jgi:putative DNA primase/helicase
VWCSRPPASPSAPTTTSSPPCAGCGPESKPIQCGDEAALYLAGRGLKLYDLPESIRVHPALRYQDGETVGTYAAMLATVTAPDGRAVSLHRTYLQEARKAPVTAPKKLMQGLPLSGPQFA